MFHRFHRFHLLRGFRGLRGLRQGDVGAVAPDLRGGLAVIAEPKNVLAWLQVGRDLYDIAHCEPVPTDSFAFVARGGELGHARSLVAIARADADRVDLVAAGAVAARRLRACRAGLLAGVDTRLPGEAAVRGRVGVVGARDATRTEERGRLKEEARRAGIRNGKHAHTHTHIDNFNTCTSHAPLIT